MLLENMTLRRIPVSVLTFPEVTDHSDVESFWLRSLPEDTLSEALMHRTAGWDDTAGFPAQGTGVDQFSGNADRDFLRCHSLDGGSDGGVNTADGFFGNTPFPEFGIYGSCLFPGADNAHIGKVSTKHLILNFQIEAVSVGHDDDVILRSQLQGITDSGIVTHDDSFCGREVLPAAVFLPLLKNGDTEADGVQQRCQGLGAMTAAKDDGPFPDRQGQTENIFALFRLPAAACCLTGDGFSQNSQSPAWVSPSGLYS